ncbi:MAG: YdeI/OmpD-associated family protein [Anaerolineae bacterium]|nr:YdeI/OmpD-associated family protein [Anaerolineae bacterium]
MNPKVDAYLIDGCSRCPLWKTPDCKVHTWHAELEKLRMILLDSALTEDLKWKIPCYTFENNNIVLMSAFKEYCSVNFFKGALLKDAHGVLEKPGENTQAARLMKFTNVQEIEEMEPILKAYIDEAIAVEKAGLEVAFKTTPEPIPEELQDKFDEDPAFQMAFEALTPGRQRGYILYFSGAKQSKTRTSRIEKYIPQIFEGKGFYDG